MIEYQDNQGKFKIDFRCHYFFNKHYDEEQHVNWIHIGKTIKLWGDPALPLYPMINVGIYVHLIDSDLIKDLLDILTIILRVFLFLTFLPRLIYLRIYLRRVR